MTISDSSVRQRANAMPEPAIHLQELAVEFEEFGLGGQEAAVVLALLQLGTANTAELAKSSGITRTNVYRVLEWLAARGLAIRVAAEGAALWTSPGRNGILDIIYAEHEERLREIALRAARLRERLAVTFPDSPGNRPLPQIHLMHKASETQRTYKRLLEESSTEVLAFVRQPFAWTDWARLEIPSPYLGPLGRGVTVKTLYEKAAVDDPAASALRTELESCARAGEQLRIYDGTLPMKLSIFDRRISLVALVPAGQIPQKGFPATMVVDDLGFAEVQAAAFDRYWADGEQLDLGTAEV